MVIIVHEFLDSKMHGYSQKIFQGPKDSRFEDLRYYLTPSQRSFHKIVSG